MRCSWAGSELLASYHDEEWGVAVHGECGLFEILTLEGAQAGLSWETVLRKRDGYRRLFASFDPVRVARFGDDDVERLLADPGIIRHRGKVESTIGNARAILALDQPFAEFVWGFVDGTPIVNRFEKLSDLPAQTELSTSISKELKRLGFRFVGPTTVYSFLQAAGLVNDHVISCPRWSEVQG
ncbi:MAG: DNA-3-methyladenine glycosylase I [Planctomycetota bacterium]